MYCTTACYMYKVKINKNLAAIINFVISVIPNKKLQSRLLIKPITHLLLQFLSNKNGPQSVSPFQLKINTKTTHLNNIQIPPKASKRLPKRLAKHPITANAKYRFEVPSTHFSSKFREGVGGVT